MSKKVFISGPITGVQGYKWNFAAAKELIVRAGMIPVNPAVLPEGMEPGDYMHVTISMMEICDMVLMLEGWENSGGAKIESEYAKYIGIPCLSMGTFAENYLGDQEDPEAPERAAEEETGKPTEKAATRAERM